MPASLRDLFLQSHDTSSTVPYLYFVTTEVWNNDVRQGGNDPNSKEWQKQRLLLMVIESPINLRGTITDVDITTVESEEMQVFHSVLPAKPEATFLTFPYKDSGTRINGATSGLYIFDNEFFKFQNKGDELREVFNHDFVHAPSRRKKPYKSVTFNYISYQGIKQDVETYTYQLWLNDCHMNFIFRWLMRNSSLNLVTASEVMDTMVTVCVQRFFKMDLSKATMNPARPDVNMSVIHVYLDTHVDILYKKFLFFTQNDGNSHWWGWVAINPWYHLTKILQRQEEIQGKKNISKVQLENKYVSGLLACDGMNPKRNTKDALCFVWFLNLALAYRDMMVEGVYKNFNLGNHTAKSYWLMGCCGPFGIIDIDLLGKITFPTLRLDNKIQPKQHDGWNCGIIWCLFVYNMMQQASVPYDFKFDKKQRHLLPIDIGIGKTWIHPDIYSQYIENNRAMDEKTKEKQKLHESYLYSAVQEEIVILLERLRYL